MSDSKPFPWDSLFPKQKYLLDLGRQDAQRNHPYAPTVILAEGPRKAGKSIGVLHRIMLHLWETKGARFAMVVKRTKSATDGGVWIDLKDIVMPVWQNSCYEVEYTTVDKKGTPGPITDSKTRTIYFKIRNYSGGESEMRLFVIDHESQAEEITKNTRWSGVYVSELSNFNDKVIFTSTWQVLRMMHLAPWQHLWISDTNPDPAGEDSWIYKLFISKTLYPPEHIPSDEEKRAEKAIMSGIRHVQFTLDDNISMTPEERDCSRGLYLDDPGKMTRDFEGLWVHGHGNKGKHFADLFRPHHVIGGGPGESGVIELDPNTTEMFTGWDLGQTNHGAGILEKRMVQIGDKFVSSWNVIDDLLYIGEQLETTELGLEMLSKIERLEMEYGKKFDWTHWSDDSAVTTWRAGAASFDYLLILIATQNKILLQGVNKPSGSVEARVMILRRLLRQGRLFVSARCKSVIDMLENCREGKTEYVLRDNHRHVFDWLTYPIFMEMHDELAEMSKVYGANTTRRDLGLISVRLA